MKYIKIITPVIILLLLSSVVVGSTHVHALPIVRVVADLKGDAQNGLNQVGGSGTSLESVVSSVVTIISFVAGIAGVIMIILSGIKYTTSGGDSAKVSSAKTTLAYALIGLAIAALAQFLVHFALSTATGNQPCATDSHILANDPRCK